METLKKDERKILETFEKIIPSLTKEERERLLSFGEGIAFKVEQLKETDNKKAG